MIKNVTNCYDCPFQNNDQEDGFSCNHPNNNIEEFEMTSYKNQNEECIPEKCPLRNGDIIITIKKNAVNQRTNGA